MLIVFVIALSVLTCTVCPLSTIFKLKGINFTLSAACASGSHSIGMGYLLIKNGYQDRVICGGAQEVNVYTMGSFDGLGFGPPAGVEFMTAVTEWQQAQYTLHAYQIAQNSPQIGPMILWNLNFGPLLGDGYAETGYSILRPDSSPRPVYLALQAAPKE